MIYHEYAERIDYNLKFGNRYMRNKLYVCLQELSTSHDLSVQKFAEDRIERLQGLREPFNFQTGEIQHYSDHTVLTEISIETINFLHSK